MYVTLKCCRCEKKFQVDGAGNELLIQECPKCGNKIRYSDMNRIIAVMEPFLAHAAKTTSIEICEIRAGDLPAVDTGRFAAELFTNDMEHLKEVFHTSSQEVQDKLAMLMDKLYLMAYHDARDANLKNLNKTFEELHELFQSRVRKGFCEITVLPETKQENTKEQEMGDEDAGI